MSDLSMLIAAKLRMEAVQHMTSQATHASHSASPRPQTPRRTWRVCVQIQYGYW